MIAKKVVDTLTDQIADSLADTIDELTKAITATTTGLVENLGVTLDDKIKEIQRIKLEHPFGWSIEVNFDNRKYDFDAAIAQLEILAKKDPEKAKALLKEIAETLQEETVGQDRQKPDVTIFSQHGMTDDSRDMASLAAQLQIPNAHIVAPDLGWVNTLVEFDGLVQTVETSTAEAFERYPDIPARILATSLGGILWIEVLSRHREWWPRIESLILLGVPIGGANLARMVDPFGWGVGIAKPLGENRRPLAEKVTAKIPTLVIAGDMFQKGHDMMVPVEATKLNHAHFVCLNNVTHKKLKTHPDVVETIQAFWSELQEPLPASSKSLVTDVVAHFRQVNGMTDASQKYFTKAKTQVQLTDGTTIRTHTDGFRVKHVFVADADGQCEFCGYVGWLNTSDLDEAIEQSQTLFNVKSG
ncbi:alpha/beta hydrolase [Leptothoe sp. PORK10 BA2]|uniref:alpha/beta hydrolase n=1 Tax=Leptothoe sp. PORK10 BA2 TaxID=3110254 RepID=UPI002B21D422|nr:alpha/beta hydrolase [Leptothoe sp. PORK10 BA2]MEA5462808.1 alpha/beta hydrolase [Leptothoe sp. PORK10 BA2]